MSHSKLHTLCVAPWMHAKLLNNGSVSPCCRSDNFYYYGNLNENSFEEIWNSPHAKSLRLQMMDGEKPKICHDCFYLESLGLESYRETLNKEFSDVFTTVSETLADGSDKSFKLKFIDIRFSNLCNFSCRTCNAEHSTSWYTDSKLLGVKSPGKNLNESQLIYQGLQSHLSSVERLYFAGGEPLMHKEHYALLEDLIKKDRRDVTLPYNTNMSVLSWNDKSVLKLWKYFDNVSLSLSLDGVGLQGEMIRKGMNYDEVVKNWKLVRVFCPHVNITISPTISVLNAFHLPKAFMEWVSEGLILKSTTFDFNMLNEPSYYNISIFNQNERQKLQNCYENFFQELEKTILDNEQKAIIVKNFQRILTWLNGKEENPKERSLFREMTEKLNEIRNEKNWFEVFPEHVSIF